MVRPTEVVPGGEGPLDDLQLMIHSGFEFEDHAAIAHGFRLENYVPLTATVDVRDGVA
ncbi:hypothetical protein MHEI_18660 [Mycobacterium heidelbergense]|nr:hypothetical protein MHEI_18660 [Mycobacterium heidelbergense]